MNKEVFDLTFGEELYVLKVPMTVVLNKPWKDITSEEMTLLGKILGSVKQSVNSVKVVCETTPDAASFTTGARVLLFGAQLLPAIQEYQVSEKNGAVFIQADALSALDDVRKKNLWTAMKQGFLGV